MAIEDNIDLELVSDFSGLTPAQKKIYQKRYDHIVKIMGDLEKLKSQESNDKVKAKISSKRRELIARVVTEPSAYKTESAWTTAARIAERDEVHHKIPLNKYSKATYSLRPRDIINLHEYLADQEVYLGNHPLNTVSLHEVTHKGSKQAKFGEQGSSQASAHPRGTFEGDPFEFDIQTPKQRAASIADLGQEYQQTVTNVLQEEGLEWNRRQNLTKALVEAASTRGYDLQKFVDNGIDILDPKNRDLLPKVFKQTAAWLRGAVRENANSLAGEMFGIKGMYQFDPISPAVKKGLELAKKNLGGSLLGAVYSLADSEMQQAIDQGDGGKVAAGFAQSILGGAAIEQGAKFLAQNGAIKYVPQAAQRLAQLGAPAMQLAGPVSLAATLGGSQDVKVQEQKFQQYAETLPPQQAAEIRQRRQTSLEEQSKPLIDGDQLFASITNELKFIGGQVKLGKIPYFN
jgi:hypothetical protein